MLPEKYHYFGIILNLWLDAETPKEFIQAFLRKIVGPDFNVDRIGIFQFSNGDIEFLFGIGDPLPTQHEMLIIDIEELKQHGELLVPTPGIGFDYYIRAGKFIFGFDDTQSDRTFTAVDQESLRDISGYLSRLLTAKIKDAGIKHAAKFDELTDLPRRQEGLAMLTKMVEALRRGEAKILIVAILDIDNFKKINDGLGHLAGDKALKHVSALARQIVEESGGHISRMGGEEFLILVAHEHIIEQVRRKIEATPTKENGYTLNPTASIGFVVIDRELARLENIEKKAIKAADDALYAVKRSGKNATRNGSDHLK